MTPKEKQELARARENLANMHLMLAKYGKVKDHIKAAQEYRREARDALL
jgi:hypothetical protein